MKQPNQLMRQENNRYFAEILDAKEFIQARFGGVTPKMAVVLGSGLGGLADDAELKKETIIPYSTIPHFPQSAVVGHAGNLILATYKDNPVVLLAGRTHFYEAAGIPDYNGTQAMKHITLPVRALKGLGIDALVLSNAAGGLDSSWVPPQLMISDSVINRSGANPLRGLNIDLLGPRFPPMGGDECDPVLSEYFRQAAREQGTDLTEGI